MKNILVTLPVKEEHKKLLEQSVQGGAEAYEFTYTEGAMPTEEQLRSASIIVGWFETEQAKLAERLEWLQLSFAGADAYARDGVEAVRLAKNFIAQK